ncbi:Dnaj homolog subfamily b member 13 [Phtheirospermum japonicum]|uniref:Dnaj homolog subfamily b member 13 n=1 Tax=Phtheirospermum japonicum TaxID=374723 RepID=A0A830BV05_9LAMI|nr:Dnaj homolog subfamily b member 13 [Phtheirospermum japonicum]
MVDNSRSNSQDLFRILGFGTICKACKSFVSKCYPEKNSIFFKKMGNIIKKSKSTEQDSKVTRRSCWEDTIAKSPQWSPPVHTNTGPSRLSRTTSHGPSSPLSRSMSRRAAPATRSSLLRTLSQINSDDASSSSVAFQRSLSRSVSRTGPIIYSNSNGLIKPHANEEPLDCTLEELCFGCIKKIKITRDAITENRQRVEQEEKFTIKVEPGWQVGTKITFEGRGNEILGADPADVIFTISEKTHPLFTRKEDDLELKVDIPLVDALTGCTLSIPLLGGQLMRLTIDDVIRPGDKKIIEGQGMPRKNDPTTRGNLIITFSIKFPDKLTDKQRSEAANILRQVC